MADQPNLPQEELVETPEIRCEHCTEVYDENELYTIKVGRNYWQQWCADCIDYSAFYCDDCMMWFSNNWEASTVVRSNVVCESCVSNYEFCEDCYEVTDDCECGSRLIHDHSYKPNPVFHSGTQEVRNVRTGLHFGIELETEMRNEQHRTEIAEFINSEMSDGEDSLYLKSDGSLYHGIEIVSHPRTYASWLEYSEFNDLLTSLRQHDVRSWNTSSCGLHVHMSRSAFTDSHLMRFAMFFTRNEADIVVLAARVSNYANFNPLRDKLAMKVKGWGASHFDALNLGHAGSPTVECRIFKPSLRIERVIGAIQFLNALYEYTKPLTSHDVNAGALEWPRFLRYMDESGHNLAYAMAQGIRFNTEKVSS